MEWVNIKDRLPEEGQRVLCFNGYIYLKDYDSVFYDGERHWTGSRIGQIAEVTHWMPLPQPPKE